MLAELGLVATGGRAFLDFDFPVMFLAHPADDRIACTRDFLAELRARHPYCRVVEAPALAGHFFPSNVPEFVIAEAEPWVRLAS